MGINLVIANEQAQQAKVQARKLQELRKELLSFQGSLQSHWNGREMTYINRAIENILKKLASTSGDLNNIGADIATAASAVKRAEDLEAAKKVLHSIEYELNKSRESYELAQNLYNATPSSILEVALNSAKNRYNRAVTAYNAAAYKVRALS